MTFRSHKKLQTTPPSTLGRKAYKPTHNRHHKKWLYLLLAIFVIAPAAVAQDIEIRDPAKAEPAARKKSPLDWFRQRSKNRWSFLKDEAARQKEARRIKEERRQQEIAIQIQSQRQQRHAVELQPQPAPFPDVPNPQPSPVHGLYRDNSQSSLIGTIQPTGLSKIDIAYRQTTRDPKQLKKITEILPYGDYQPSTTVQRKVDPELQAPEETELDSGPAEPRQMEPLLYQWNASNLHHYPLYFEDPNLERYGHAHHPLFQPFVSTGRMGLQLIGLPYQMTIDPVCKPVYTLGWYRPGECAPKQVYQVPWNTRAAINQALVTTGAFYALP